MYTKPSLQHDTGTFFNSGCCIICPENELCLYHCIPVKTKWRICVGHSTRRYTHSQVTCKDGLKVNIAVFCLFVWWVAHSWLAFDVMASVNSMFFTSICSLHRRRNRSGWSGYGRTILSQSWDIITRLTFVWSRIAVVKFGRYVPKCARIRLTFSMTKLPGLRIPVWSWSAMRVPPHC